MAREPLMEMDFTEPKGGWDWPPADDPCRQVSAAGLLLDGGGTGEGEQGKGVLLDGPGVHTRNGHVIQWRFRLPAGPAGKLELGYSGGFERAYVTLDMDAGELRLNTYDWSVPQPVRVVPLELADQETHVLRLEKEEGVGTWVKMAHLRVWVDGQAALDERNLNLLPEMGVFARMIGGQALLTGFTWHGEPHAMPENLHVGGWQVLNRPDIAANLASLKRGLRAAAEVGVQLLVTPETSLTGLFPTHPVTYDRRAITEAEGELRRFLADLPDAPYLVAGLPIWRPSAQRPGEEVRFNVSRVYDPDGGIAYTGAKIHSCETDFWHGYRLHEFDVYGVPVCMHICHDGRYPEVWTLPVMFGARLVLHPANGGQVSGSIDALEKGAQRATSTSHAFYVHVNGGGGSYMVGPGKFDNLLAVSDECQRDVTSFPMVGEPVECLLHANLRIHDAYGYWPVRSFRASEEAAGAYQALYRALGGVH